MFLSPSSIYRCNMSVWGEGLALFDAAVLPWCCDGFFCCCDGFQKKNFCHERKKWARASSFQNLKSNKFKNVSLVTENYWQDWLTKHQKATFRNSNKGPCKWSHKKQLREPNNIIHSIRLMVLLCPLVGTAAPTQGAKFLLVAGMAFSCCLHSSFPLLSAQHSNSTLEPLLEHCCTIDCSHFIKLPL